MDEFYKEFEKKKKHGSSSGGEEITDDEAEELFKILQDSFSTIKDNVKEDVDKLIEYDKKRINAENIAQKEVIK